MHTRSDYITGDGIEVLGSLHLTILDHEEKTLRGGLGNFMTSLNRTSKSFLNLSMKCQIIASQPVTFRKHLDYEFTSTAAADMISSRALRQDYNIKRDEFRRRQESLNSQIKLIDGSKMDLSDSKPHKLRSQPKQDAKIESQIAIKQQRTQEKIFSEIVRILMSGILSVELFKKPVWRLTRMVPNSDMRGYSIFWIIDNENDITAYKVIAL